MADREGFEPSVLITQYDGLANRCLKPLGHRSIKIVFLRIKLLKINQEMFKFQHLGHMRLKQPVFLQIARV